jgi:hypothetical protein
MPTAEGHSLVEAHGYDVVEPQLAMCPPWPGPDWPNPKTNRPS